MQYKGLTLDPFQEQAINAIHQNKSVVVSAPTGSGKTLIADYIINRDIQNGKRIIYTAPIKALSNQKYKEFSKDYGEENVGLLTGDVAKNPHAPVLIMTTEVYRNMAMVNDETIEHVSYVVFDEIHYINDEERGTVWEESIIFSKPEVRMLCLSATIPNADEFAQWVESIKHHKVEVIRHDVRSVPLYVSFYDTELGITSLKNIHEIADIADYGYLRGRSHHRRPHLLPPSHLDLVKEIKDKVPCIFFSFSRMACQKFARELQRKNIFPANPEISRIIREKLAEAPREINQLESTQILRQTLPFGIGFHHAGLLPLLKELVEDLFGRGLVNMLYTTETFAVGINMPAKTVCFASLRKFDGRNFRLLNSKEFFQIAGRAGRRGIDKEGFVYILIDRRDFEYEKIKAMTTADTEPIMSQFRLSVNTVLNLIKQHSHKEIDEILRQNFHSFQEYGPGVKKTVKMHMVFQNLKKKLEKLGYINNNALTEKGEFASKIYSDEILTAELFATDFYKSFNEYQILMLLASICYEHRERTVFHKKFHSPDIEKLQKLLHEHPYFSKEKRFSYMKRLTALTQPCYTGITIFDIINHTTLLEGDIIRFFRQIIDRINQVKNATRDFELIKILENIQYKIIGCMKDIDVI